MRRLVSLAVVILVAVLAACATARSAATVRVAVIDTGVNPVGPLAGRVDRGADFADTAGQTTDPNGHGTELAGVVVQQCAACRILAVRAVGADGTGQTAAVAQAVRWTVGQHVQVIDISLTSAAEDPGLTAAIEQAVVAGVVVVVAAGNLGSADPSAQGYPGAAAMDAITVTSTESSGRSSQHLAGWANHGPWVRLAAPGMMRTVGRDGTVGWVAGTSDSAAYVAGVAGAMVAAHPGLPPSRVAQLLEQTATPLVGLPTPGGLVNPAAAVRAAKT